MIGPAAKNRAQFGNSNVTGLAHLIFTKYVFPFELTSALLITAALGAMVLAHRERTSPKPTQRELARAAGRQRPATPAAGPGTYAQHNAADMPALLPDGSQPGVVSHVLARPRTGARRRRCPGPARTLTGRPASCRPGRHGASSAHGGQEAGEQWYPRGTSSRWQ